MITVKKLSNCTLVEANEAWNYGFEDYYVNLQMSVNQFTFRLGQDEISPDYSFVAFSHGLPVGLLLNGIKVLNGKKWGWNGGTCVVPTHRRSGVGRALMNATMELYRNEGVDIATLEAFSINQKAISLYEEYGYKKMDRLLFLEHNNFSSGNSFTISDERVYSFERGVPRDVSIISFYDTNIPWKTQWNFIQDGESLIIKNHQDEIVGFTLYSKRYTQVANIPTILLFQCVVKESQQNKNEIIKKMLGNIYPVGTSYRIATYNLPSRNHSLVEILKESGFKELNTATGTPMEQVLMVKELNQQ